MRASLVVLDADRRRHRHALQHLQHHTQGLFPLFPRTITSVFFKIVWLFPPISPKNKKQLFRNEQVSNIHGLLRIGPCWFEFYGRADTVYTF